MIIARSEYHNTTITTRTDRILCQVEHSAATDGATREQAKAITELYHDKSSRSVETHRSTRRRKRSSKKRYLYYDRNS